MFAGAIRFDHPLDSWNVATGTDFVSCVLDTHNMFVCNTGEILARLTTVSIPVIPNITVKYV